MRYDPELWGRLVHDKYDQLGFKLHQPTEWTVVAGILLVDPAEEVQVIAVGAGVKCLPAKSVSSSPLCYQLVRDSHAEVLARRALIAYLYNQMVVAETSQGPSILVGDRKDGFSLKEGYSLGTYISQAPCGDASMHLLPPFLPQRQVEEGGPNKRVRTLRGRDHTGLRGMRTKPGRADSPPCESMSCTDKIALWSVVGWQGAILSRWLRRPICIDTLVVAEGFDCDSLREAIGGKAGVDLKFLEYTGESFRYGQIAVTHRLDNKEELTPASVGHAWFLVPSSQTGSRETLCDGRRLGAGKPRNGHLNPKCQSILSTESLLRLMGLDSTTEDCAKVKKDNCEYQERKAKIFAVDGQLTGWIQSNPILEEFRRTLETS